jgi:hypothetical protein
MSKKSSKSGFFHDLGHLVSTFVENVRQITPFIQNKPNYRKTTLIHKHRLYNDLRKILPPAATQKTNPNKPNLKNHKNARNPFFSKDLQWNLPFYR